MSHKRIIEFEVHSEEDVENIVANDIQESDTVRFYGFSPKDIVDEAMQAKYQLAKFIFYRYGSAYPRSECNCKTFRNRRNSALLEVTIKNRNYGLDMLSASQGSPEAFSFGRFYNWGMALAKSKGYEVKTCHFCNHRHYDYNKKKLTCDLTPDESFDASRALSCRKYMLDEDCYHKYLDEFTKFSQNNIMDVWSKT